MQWHASSALSRPELHNSGCVRRIDNWVCLIRHFEIKCACSECVAMVKSCDSAPSPRRARARALLELEAEASYKGWSLLYPVWSDLRPGSRGSHWVTEVFHKWSPGHGAKIAIPRSQSTNMDEVVRYVKY